MKKILRLLKRVWILNFFRRLRIAFSYYVKRLPQILRWGFRSNEDTNFTYDLSPDNILYLALTIEAVTGTGHQTILKYIEELQSDTELRQNILRSMENSSEGRFADREIHYGKRLGWYALARALKPGVVIETGVDKGLGSVILCAAILKNRAEGFAGKYYGTDINPKAGYLLQGKYREAGEILYGDSISSLSSIRENIGLFINDSDHSADYEYREYQCIRPLIDDKTFILGDNAHSTNKLALFSAETGRNFIFFQESPLNHWYPGGGIGISYKPKKS